MKVDVEAGEQGTVRMHIPPGSVQSGTLGHARVTQATTPKCSCCNNIQCCQNASVIEMLWKKRGFFEVGALAVGTAISLTCLAEKCNVDTKKAGAILAFSGLIMVITEVTLAWVRCCCPENYKKCFPDDNN